MIIVHFQAELECATKLYGAKDTLLNLKSNQAKNFGQMDDATIQFKDSVNEKLRECQAELAGLRSTREDIIKVLQSLTILRESMYIVALSNLI